MDIEVTSEEDCPFLMYDIMPPVCVLPTKDGTSGVNFCSWDKEYCPLLKGETVVVKKKE